MSYPQVSNALGVVDPRRNAEGRESLITEGNDSFTSNAIGSTTTIVGADPTPGTGLRIGDKIKLFDSGGVKEETVFTVDSAASATGSTTYTFSPVAAVATASGDTARIVSTVDYESLSNIDTRLKAISSTTFSDKVLRTMSYNDKVFALRSQDDSAGIN